MANGLYAKGREEILKGNIDLENDTIKAVCVDTATYTVNLNTDEDLADIPSGERVATSSALTVTVSGGTVDVADFTFSSVSGDEFEAVVFYKDTGSAATSTLILYIDTATGLSFTPSGGDIDVTINASGLFTWGA
jgi:tartrate dehydratase alpha subunit/fumarate hydratase class I-like protein